MTDAKRKYLLGLLDNLRSLISDIEEDAYELGVEEGIQYAVENGAGE